MSSYLKVMKVKRGSNFSLKMDPLLKEENKDRTFFRSELSPIRFFSEDRRDHRLRLYFKDFAGEAEKIGRTLRTIFSAKNMQTL